MTRMDEDQRRLAEAHYDLALRLARGLSRRYRLPRDEAESICLETLCVAAIRFDPSLSADFGAMLNAKCRFAIVDEIQVRHGLNGRKRRIAAIGGRAAEIEMEHADSGSPHPGRDVEERDAAERLLSCLPGPHRRVMRRLYIDEDSPSAAAVGRSLGLCESRISAIKAEAIGRIRAHLEKSA